MGNGLNLKSPRRRHWLLLALLAALAAGVVVLQLVLIRPFAPQTPGLLAFVFALRRWSPWLTLAALLFGIVPAVGIWRSSHGWSRAAVLLSLGLLVLTSWLARQNHFEWIFKPLPGARFVRAVDASFVAPGDMVLAVDTAGDAVAYPVRQLAYHHLVNDSVGRVPIVATY